MNDAVIGKEVDGYRIQAVLGRGGMGTVYRAEDVNLSRTVAIKRINPSQAERESFIHRFRSEAQALARIDSSHIVGVYALRETDIGLLIVMEYVEGGTLKDPLNGGEAMAPGQVIPILDQIMHAFHDAHSAGVIHRDIKPQNIMLRQDGIVKVTDFGIAKLRQPDSGETVTQGGQGGTLKYMSPEQISNISEVDARSDLYSIGMTAYEMLAGCLPFKETDTDFDIMRKVVEGKIPPPDEYNPDIPSGLAQWVMGAVQKEQKNRYQSAEEMLEALRKADQQVDVTMTQPEWEIDDGSADADNTQTVVPSDEDRTQTVVPGGEEDDGDEAEPLGQTVMDPAPSPEMGSGTQPSVAPAESADEGQNVAEPSSEEEAVTQETGEGGTRWGILGGGIVAALVIIVGGYIAYTQFMGGGGEAATLSLTTTPAWAIVLVNGDTAGTTPLDGYALEAGAVQLQVRKDGFVPMDTMLTAAGGGDVLLQNIALNSTSSEGGASNAALSGSSNEQASADPAEEIETSRTAESASSDDQEPSSEKAQSDASVSDGGTEAAEANAASAVGVVNVTAEPSGRVFVDGERRSGTSIELRTGEHIIECRHSTHGSVETRVTVSEGETESLTCYFEQQVAVTGQGGPWGRIWLNQTDTGKETPSTFSLPPGEHQVEVRTGSRDNVFVDGGIARTKRGGESQIEKFTGTTYRIQVEPTFEKVEHAVSFKISGE